MAHTNRTAPSIFTSAVEAIAALFEDGFNQLRHAGVTEAIFTHGELEEQLVPSKSVCFYRRFVPLRNEMISLIVNAYRGFFKLAIANPTQTGNDPDLWTRTQLTPAVFVAFVWIHDWYILACEGESQSVQRVASLPFVP